MILPQRYSRAFTLLEVVVALVVLAVLAAIAIPTFTRVINRTHDKVAELELIGLQKQAWSEASIEGVAGYSAQDFLNGSTGSAAAPGVYAADLAEGALKLYPVAGPSSKHLEVSIGLSDTANPAAKAGLAMMSNAKHCVYVFAEKGTVTSSRIDENPKSSSNPTGVPCQVTETSGGGGLTGLTPKLTLEAPTPPNPGNASALLSFKHIAGATSYKIACLSPSQPNGGGFLVKAKEGTFVAPGAQLVNTPAARSIAGPSAPPVYKPSSTLNPDTVIKVTLDQLENFVTYTCTVTALSSSPEPVVSNEVSVTPSNENPGDTTGTGPGGTNGNDPTDGTAGTGLPQACNTSCPMPGEWVSPGNGFNPPQKSIPEPPLPEEVASSVPASTGPDGLSDGLYGLASFSSGDNDYKHNIFVTDRSNGSLLQVAETSDGVGYGRTVLGAGSFNRPSGVVGGPHSSHNGHWSASQSQVSDTLYVADQGAGKLYRVDPNARLRLPVVSGLNSPSDAAGFACFSSSDTVADPAMTNGPAYCVYVVTASGVVRYRINDGATATIPNIPAGEAIEPVLYNNAPALAVSEPLSGAVKLYRPKTGNLVATISGFTKPAGIDLIGNKLVVADPGANNVKVVDLPSGTSSTIAGTGAPAPCAGVSQPRDAHWHGVHAGAAGGPDVYVSDSSTGNLVKVRLSSSFTCISSSVVWGKPSALPATTPLGAITRIVPPEGGDGYLATSNNNIYYVDAGKRLSTIDPSSGSLTQVSTFGYSAPYSMVIKDGMVYLSDISCYYSLSCNSVVKYPVGSSSPGSEATEVLAQGGKLSLSPDGNIYLMKNNALFKMGTDGSLQTIVSDLGSDGTFTAGASAIWFYSGGTRNIYKLEYGTTYNSLPATPWRTGLTDTVYTLMEDSGFLWEGNLGNIRRTSINDSSSFRNMVTGYNGVDLNGTGPLAAFGFPLSMTALDGFIYFSTQGGRVFKLVGAPDFPASQQPEMNSTLPISTGEVSTVANVPNPSSILHVKGKIYSVSGGSLYETDVATNATRVAATSYAALSNMATDGTFIYLTATSCGYTNCISYIQRYHPGTSRMLGTGPYSAGFSGIAYGKDRFLYTMESGNLRRYDTNTWVGTTVASGVISAGSNYGKLTADNQYLWVTSANKLIRVGYDGSVTDNFATVPGISSITASGDYLFAVSNLHEIKRIDAATGKVTPVAGNTSQGSLDGVGAEASFNQPYGITSNGTDALYVADYLNNKIRKITAAQALPSSMSPIANTTIAISPGNVSSLPDVHNNVSAPVVVGNYLYVYDSNGIEKINRTTGAKSVLAPLPYYYASTAMTTDGTFLYSASTYCYYGCTGTITRISLATGQYDAPWAGGAITGLTFGADKNLYVSVSGTLKKIDAKNFAATTVPGVTNSQSLVADNNGIWFASSVDTPADSISQLGYDGEITPDVFPNIPYLSSFAVAGRYIYTIDRYGKEVRRYDTQNGAWTSIAGGADTGSSDGTGSQAHFNQANGITSDGESSLYLTDYYNKKIRKIVDGTPLPVTQPVANNTSLSLTGDVSTLSTAFNPSNSVVVHNNITYGTADNRLYKLNGGGTKTEEVNLGGTGTSLATDGTFIYVGVTSCYYSCNSSVYRYNPASKEGDTIYSTSSAIKGLAVGTDGKIYVSSGGALKKIDPVTLVVSTLSTQGISSNASSIASDSSGIWVQDGNSISRVSYAGAVSTDVATVSDLQSISSAGDSIYASTRSKILKVNKTSGAVSFVAGGTDFGSSDGQGSNAQINNYAFGQLFTHNGYLLLADYGNNAIRKIS